MRQYYTRPHFLPADAEHAHVDYIFMGYQQGAVMHVSTEYPLTQPQTQSNGPSE